jgi:hypothetical protein
MRHLMIILVAVVLAVPAYGGVTILSQQHRVCGKGLRDDYDITDTVPISGVTDGRDASSSSVNFSVEASTQASWGWAAANSSYIFTIDQPSLTISLIGSLWSRAFPDRWGHISYSLSDYTTGEFVGGQSWSLSEADSRVDDWGNRDWGRNIDEAPSFDELDTNHEYTLNLSASVTNADGTWANLNAILIPEPASLLLLGLGRLLIRKKIHSVVLNK